ncbi:uncharacterized protein KY384_002437 [Bacidia gigantensis]|uniref:uncharacterized protein n=1 Tax=Bacidia gigantensis TaxID=2732470 RepID=UPI001D043686|nr:uncharacterized protein KY384_002437 [Bacidia gigantensis]KAG8532560.1 hypothetical protein KY384_002437 [Bacidia gigantensis]
MPPNAQAINGQARRSIGERPSLRQATLVLPSGERVKGNVTFGPPSPRDGVFEEQRSPLLGEYAVSPEKQQSSVQRSIQYVKRRGQDTLAFANSRTGRGVFKCSIAYLLGSMATFVPWIYHSLGKSGGKHVVATITVYYHPARSIGSACEALICSMAAWLYVAAVSFSSMGVSILFGKSLDLIVVGHVIVLIVFCGGGLGFVGWVKQRYSHAVVNISCSLAALALITVLTKEGAVQVAQFSVEKVNQELKMVLMGVAFSTITSLLLFPVSACKDLRADMIRMTDLFGDVLAVITRGFLTGSDEELQSQDYADAYANYKKIFASMSKNLKEAKREHYVLGSEKSGWSQLTPRSRTMLESLDETPEVRSIETNDPVEMDFRVLSDDDSNSLPPIRSPSDIFTRFIAQLGPSMVGED